MITSDQERVIIYSVTDGLKSRVTKTGYRKTFTRFLDHFGIDERVMLTQAAENPKRLEQMIISYVKHLAEKRNLGHDSIHTYCFAIFHFFDMNDIPLNKRKIIRFLPPNEGPREDRAYTHLEIEQILDKCDERSKVVILLMASTGMRIGALSTLQVGDLTKLEDYNLYKITVYANSRKDRYYTFTTPECALAIDSYLDYRKRFGEIIKPAAPLIREQFDTSDSLKIKRPIPMGEEAFFYLLKQVLRKSGMKSKKVKQSHGFRKFAITQMIKAKIDYGAREYLVGHRHSRGLDVNYDRTSEEDRLQEYLKAVDFLTINPENRLKTEIHRLKSEHSEEWNQLKAQMNELKRLIQPFDS